MKSTNITLEDFLKAVDNGMKVLHLDCETSLGTFCGFQIGSKISVSHEQVLTAPQVMSVQYKWEGDKKAKFVEWQKVRKRTIYDSGFCNKKMMVKVSELINQADIIVGQNLDAFDMKMLQNALKENDLNCFNYDATLDILKMSRKTFRPLSHKLDYRSKVSGGPGKIKMELQDWKDIAFNDVPISKKMGPYGCIDVDEEQRVMKDEFNYYRNMPVKIQKIVKRFLIEESRVVCPRCEKYRKPKFNVESVKKKHKCLNCNNKFEG